MLNINQAGIATMAIGVAAVAVISGSIATPVAVDSYADQQPDSSFYVLERAGESIKEPVLGGQNWEIGRGLERTNEFSYMVQKGMSTDYTSLILEAESHFSKATELAEDNKDLQKVEQALQEHLNVLKNVENKVPKVAKPSIILAEEQSSRHMQVIENLQKVGISINGKILKNAAKTSKNKLDEIKENIDQQRSKINTQIKKAEEKENTIDNIVSNIKNRIKEIQKETEPTQETEENTTENQTKGPGGPPSNFEENTPTKNDNQQESVTETKENTKENQEENQPSESGSLTP